jgi:hypothetical protein
MGDLLKIKCAHSRVNVNILASTSDPFMQVPNLAQLHETDNSACEFEYLICSICFTAAAPQKLLVRFSPTASVAKIELRIISLQILR